MAWAESNAIVFANSRAGGADPPLRRLHRHRGRHHRPSTGGRAPPRRRPSCHRSSSTSSAVPERLLDLDVAYPVLGHHIGKRSGAGCRVPVITGVPTGAERGPAEGDRQRRCVVGFARHVPCGRLDAGGPRSRNSACGGRHTGGTSPPGHRGRSPGLRAIELTTGRRSLTSGRSQPRHAALLGRRVRSASSTLLGDRPDRTPTSSLYVNTGRTRRPRDRAPGVDRARLEAASGFQLVTDTCTYITPVMADIHGT